MGPQSRVIFEKKTVFHLHPLKMVQDDGHTAEWMRFEILRLPSAFQVRSETTFDPLPGG